jgi:hypothetical protein
MNNTIKHPTTQKQNTGTSLQHQGVKWATFAYNGKETRKIAKLIKDIL